MNTYISLYFNVIYMYLYLIAFGCLCTGCSILETPTASTTGAGQSACNPLF